jgi:hypothetical protein
VRLIAGTDDELYGTASAAAKLGLAGKLLDRLRQAHRADPADPEPAGQYALALMAALPSIGVEFEAHARFTTTIEAFGRVLSADPEHWLARYSRVRLRALFPSSYGAFSVQVSGELVGAREDLDHLLAAQARQPHQPYFASTHALAAVVDHLAGVDDLGRRQSQLAALAAGPRRPVRLPALGAVLCEPLVTLHAGCTGPELETVDEVMSALYGDQPAVVAARRWQRVR